MNGVGFGCLADRKSGRSGHFDGILEELAKVVTPSRGPQSNADAEIVPLRITGDKRLGEDNEFGPLLSRICREVG